MCLAGLWITMTSCHTHAFHITDRFVREIHPFTMETPYKWPMMWNFGASFIVSLNMLLNKNWVVGDLRRQDAQVMLLKYTGFISYAVYSLFGVSPTCCFAISL